MSNELRGTISHDLIRPRLAELGKIKIGGKGEQRQKADGGTFRIPEKYDHFVITGRERGEDENYVKDEEIHERIGDPEPKSLKVRLLFDRVEDNFYSRLVQYSGRSKIWECDGQRAHDLKNDKFGRCRHESQGGPGCLCKPYGRLQVVLEAAPQLGGFHVFRTTSWESIQAIQSSLEEFHDMFGGRLRGLPLLLKLYPSTDRYTDSQGNARESKSYKVTLLLRGGFEEVEKAQQEVLEHRALGTEEQRKIAAATRADLNEKDQVEEEHIAEEYHPDPNDKSSAGTKQAIETMKEENGLGAEDGGSSEGVSEAEAESGEEGPSEPSAEQGEGGEEPAERPQKQALWRWLRDTYSTADEAVTRWEGLATDHPDLPDDPTTWDEDTCEQALAFVKRFGPEGVESPGAVLSEQTEAL